MVDLAAMSNTKNKYPFYSPKYFVVWLLVGLVWLISCLPYRILLIFGRGVGWLLRVADKRMVRVASINLSLCFPDMSEDQREKFLVQSYASLGQGAVETALGWWASDRRLRPLVTVDGTRHIEKAQAEGYGVLLVTSHFNSLELAGRLTSLFVDFSATYSPQRHPVIERVTHGARKKHYHDLIPKNNIRQIVRALQAGQAVFYAADTDGGKNGVFVPFLGVNASTVTAPARYAKMGNAKVIMTRFWRKPGGGYHIAFDPPLENFPSESREADALRINQSIEETVRERPSQYLWQYRRFKTRPAGEKDFYQR